MTYVSVTHIMCDMKQLAPIMVIVMIVGLGLVLLASRQREEILPIQNSAQEPSGAPSTPLALAQDKAVAGSRYLEYSNEIFTSSASKRRVLFFFANWCPTCIPADTDFKTNMAQIPADVVVIRVNYNDTDTDADEKVLAQKYGITYQHTFVQIDGSGAVVSKWNGGQTRELLTKLK